MTDEYFAQKFAKELKDTMPAWKAWYEKILKIGKSNFYFKTSPLDGSRIFIIFSSPEAPPILGTGWLETYTQSKVL